MPRVSTTNHHDHPPPTTATPTPTPTFHNPTPPLPLTAQLFFATFAVPVTPAAPVPATRTLLAVQLAPQTYPLGQHPFASCPLTPLCCAQLNQPNAHPSCPSSPGVSLTCATPIVTPLLASAVDVDSAFGQDERAQSRPRRQQPGW